MTDNEQVDEVDEQAELNEISAFAKSLPSPSAATVSKYVEHMNLLEQIHDEVRSKHSNFMPIYDPSMDTEIGYEVGKYQDNLYSVVIPRDNGE